MPKSNRSPSLVSPITLATFDPDDAFEKELSNKSYRVLGVKGPAHARRRVKSCRGVAARRA